LYNRIDPNTASWERLAVLPGIGEKRAKTIIAYRNQVQATHPDRPAFGSAEDLAQVKGIGPATVENLRPYLMFPALPVQNQP
jgi:competence protein ComEA